MGGGESSSRPASAAEVPEVLAHTPSRVPELRGYRREAPLGKSEKFEHKSFSVPQGEERNGVTRSQGIFVSGREQREVRAAGIAEGLAIEGERNPAGSANCLAGS